MGADRGREAMENFLYSCSSSCCWSLVSHSTHLVKLPSEEAFEISYRKMLYCSFRMRSGYQPLSRSHQQLQSEEVFDPHSLASSVKTLLEQHPIFKEPETYMESLRNHIWHSINWAIFETYIFSLSRSDTFRKKVYSLNL